MTTVNGASAHTQQTPPPPPPPPQHKVERGETVEEIAARYRVKPDELLAANPDIQNPQDIEGRQLNLPDHAQAPGLHHVKPGDTVSGIAAQYRQHNSSVGEIARANGLADPGQIREGTDLWIPGAAQSAPPPAQTGPLCLTGSNGSGPANAVDTAVGNYQEARENLQEMQRQAAQGHGGARAELRDGHLQRNVNEAETALKNAVTGEIRSRVQSLPGQTANQNTIAQIGSDIAGRYSDPAVQDVINQATGDYQATQAVDNALNRLNGAQDALATVQRSANQGDTAARTQLQNGTLQQNVTDARTAVQNAVAAEIQRHGGAEPSPATIDRIGADITARYTNNPAAQTAVREAVAQVKVDRQVDAILDNAEGASTPRDQLVRLNEAFTAAPAEVQNKLLANPRTGALFNSAAQQANQPLSQIPAEIQSDQDVLPHTNQAITQLSELTEGLDARLAARVVERALPGYEAISQRSGELPVFGMNGTQSAIEVADHVWGAPNGQQLVKRIVDLGTSNALGLTTPLQEGTGPTYLLELGRQGGVMPGGSLLLDASIDGANSFRSGQLADNADAYLKHVEELGYLVQNGGTAITPQQLDGAINQYVQSKGPQWKQQLENLQTQLANDGARLLNQVEQLNAGLTNIPADQRDAYRQEIAGLLNDPSSQLAVSMALRQQPELTGGTSGQQLVKTFADLGITGSGNALATSLVTAYLRENVMEPAANIDLSNPASLQAARGELADALRNNPDLARVLEITPDQLNQAADNLIELVPRPSSGIDGFEYANNIARNSNNALDKLDEVFGRDTPFNRGFRVSAVAIVGSGLANAADNFAENPTLRNGLDVFVESARVGVDSAQLIAAMRNLPADSSAVTGLKAAGRFVHVLGAGLAGFDAIGRLGQGDLIGAGLNATVAGGVGYAVFGSSAWAGPIGFGVAAAASLGLFVYDGIRNAQHNSRFETDTTARFLENAGFDSEAARALIDQSGEGYSTVPLFMRYGELRGLTPEQTVNWINSIDPSRLATLRDNLHRTLDEIDGDVGRFRETADNDRLIVRDTQNRPWFAASGVARPESAVQLDAILNVLQIPIPHAS